MEHIIIMMEVCLFIASRCKGWFFTDRDAVCLIRVMTALPDYDEEIGSDKVRFR